jgi:hypothetical protein
MTTNTVSPTANSASGAELRIRLNVRLTTNIAPALSDIWFTRESIGRAEEAVNAFKCHLFKDEKYEPLADQSSKPPKNNEAIGGLAEYHGRFDETNTTKVEEPSTVDKGDREEIEGEEGEENVDYPSGVKLGLVTFGLCLATLCVALDNTVA